MSRIQSAAVYHSLPCFIPSLSPASPENIHIFNRPMLLTNAGLYFPWLHPRCWLSYHTWKSLQWIHCIKWPWVCKFLAFVWPHTRGRVDIPDTLIVNNGLLWLSHQPYLNDDHSINPCLLVHIALCPCPQPMREVHLPNWFSKDNR